MRSRSGRKVRCPGDLVQDWTVRAHLPPPSHPQWSSLVPRCPAEPWAPETPPGAPCCWPWLSQLSCRSPVCQLRTRRAGQGRDVPSSAQCGASTPRFRPPSAPLSASFFTYRPGNPGLQTLPPGAGVAGSCLPGPSAAPSPRAGWKAAPALTLRLGWTPGRGAPGEREVKVYAGPFSSATDPAEPFLGGGEGGTVFFT